MEANEIVRRLSEVKGQHVQVGWTSLITPNKENKGLRILKTTIAWCRAGINYAHLASVKEGIKSGERGEVQPLKWGEWELFPFIIKHTPKGSAEVVRYVRLYPASFDNLKPQVSYLVNGIQKTRDEVKLLCPPSTFPDHEEPPACYAPKAENIFDILTNEHYKPKPVTALSLGREEQSES